MIGQALGLSLWLGSSAWLWLGPPVPTEPAASAPAASAGTPQPDASRSPAYADVLEPLPEAQRDETKAKQLMVSAKTAFAGERYDEAIEFLAEAYRTYPIVTLLYSLGSAHRRAYERDGDIEHRRLSIRRYQQYLSSAPDGESANLAQNYLTTLLAEADLGRTELEVVTRVLVSTAVEDATMSLDGGAAQPAPGVMSVEPGSHELTVSAPGYAPLVRRVEVPEGATYQVQAELEGLPGTIVIAGPKHATVRLDGDIVGQLPIRNGLRADPGAHVLTVSKRGHDPLILEFELERQGWRSVQAQLQLSNRRVASYFLFGLGSAGAASASVLVGFTLDRQAHAQQFSDRLEGGGELTTDEYETYSELLQRRDVYRGATVLTGFAGGVLMLTAAVLYAYEGPRAADRYARVQPRGGGLSVRF